MKNVVHSPFRLISTSVLAESIVILALQTKSQDGSIYVADTMQQELHTPQFHTPELIFAQSSPVRGTPNQRRDVEEHMTLISLRKEKWTGKRLMRKTRAKKVLLDPSFVEN